MPSDASREWTIGELAKATGVTVRTLRHYDQLALLSPAGRSTSGRRRYGASELGRLYQILSLRSLGFSLSAIASLLDNDGGTNLVLLAQDQLKHVTDQLDRYQDLHRRITTLVEALGQAHAPPTHDAQDIRKV